MWQRMKPLSPDLLPFFWDLVSTNEPNLSFSLTEYQEWWHEGLLYKGMRNS